MTTELTMTPELKKRIQTAVLGVAVFLLLLTVGGPIGAVFVAAVLSVATLWEFAEITYGLPDKKEKRFLLLGGAWMLQFLGFWMTGAEFALLMISFLAFTSYYLFTADRYRDEELKRHYQELMYTLFGFVYLGFLWVYLPALRQAAYGLHWTLLFFFNVWAADSGAYFAGLKYGRRKLYEAISPKKSWEGVYGGVAAALVVTIAYKLVFFRQLSWLGAVFVPVAITSVSIVGDLAESFLKRAFSVKDSSQLLPGHGGFLDRFDGVVFSLPIMYALTRIFGAI